MAGVRAAQGERAEPEEPAGRAPKAERVATVPNPVPEDLELWEEPVSAEPSTTPELSLSPNAHSRATQLSAVLGDLGVLLARAGSAAQAVPAEAGQQSGPEVREVTPVPHRPERPAEKPVRLVPPKAGPSTPRAY